MILIKLMGFLDLLTAGAIILFNYDILGLRLFISFILYLILKGIMFKGDIASMLDLGIASYMILMIFFPITILSWIAAIYILQKGIVSFLS
jgi:hypothetical protein